MKTVMLDDLLLQLQQCHTEKEIDKFIKKYRKVQYFGDVLINAAEERITSGKYEEGMAIMFAVYKSKYLQDIADDVTLYLRLAEYYLKQGDKEPGIALLVHMCSAVENYEEALSFRNLLPVWEKYKPLVQGRVAPPVSLEETDKGETPPPEALLDELLEEVGSGGFDAYLSYHSEFFAETVQAAEQLNKPLTAALLKEIEKKFPNQKVPQSSAEAERIIMENDLNFEQEDACFYETVEKELVE